MNCWLDGHDNQRDQGSSARYQVRRSDRAPGRPQGAARVGMATVQALWFRADDTPGIEPDFMAFTPMDVLNAVRRLAL